MRIYKTLLLTILLLLCIFASAFADVNISKSGDSWKITAGMYEAMVAADGCMTSLKTGGAEFIEPDVAGTRGAYFASDVTQSLPQISKLSSNTLKASGAEAEVVWEFNDDNISFTISNKADKDMWYRMVVDQGIRFVNTGNGKYRMRPVIEVPNSDCTWVAGDSTVNIKGGTKVSGPWTDDTMVWELLMRGIQTQHVQMSFGKVDEAARKSMANAAAGRPVDYDGFLMFSPEEARVFQRQTKYIGSVNISGRTDIDCDYIEYMITGKPLKGKLPGRWKKVALNPVTRGFEDKIQIPAGGWYSFHIRAIKGGKTVLEKTINKFGVGEVFVGAGQSNSTNCGQFRTKQSSGMVSCYTGMDWQIRDDPFLGPHDSSILGSVYPYFGDMMYAKYKVPIGIASTGHGGTSVVSWNTGGELFNWTMSRIAQLGPGGFRAIMWHQGEADCGMASDEYFFRMAKLINDSNRIAGWSFPWFVAQASYADPDHSSFPSVRAGQKLLWDRKIALEGPDTDKLTKEYRDFGGIGVHFNPDGLKKMAGMWFEKISKYVDATLGDK